MDGKLVDNVSRETPSLATILDNVAAEFRVSSIGLRGPARPAYLAHPRQAFCWLALQAGKSASATGRFIDRDHTTVLYAEAAVHLRMEKDAELAARLKGLAARLNIWPSHHSNFAKLMRPKCAEEVN